MWQDVTYCSICSSDNTGPYEASDFLEDLQSLLGTDLLPCPPVSPRMYPSQEWQDMEQTHRPTHRSREQDHMLARGPLCLALTALPRAVGPKPFSHWNCISLPAWAWPRAVLPSPGPQPGSRFFLTYFRRPQASELRPGVLTSHSSVA